MNRRLIRIGVATFALIALSIVGADAQRFSTVGNRGGGSPSPPSVMLANTGSAILVNTGVKLLVQ